MRKSIAQILIITLILSLVSCTGKDSLKTGESSVDELIVSSGYNLDKASLSEAAFFDALSKITPIEKPKTLGEVELPDLSTIELKKTPVEEITDATIEAELEKERDSEMVYKPIMTKREAKLTDKVIIDFKGYVNGEALEGGSGEDYELVLGSGQFIPGFEDKVVGHQAGKKFSIDVVFPDEYAEELAGKPAKFDITIKSIEEAVTPEIDEEFIAKHTQAGSVTIDDYKAEVKSIIEKRNQLNQRDELIAQLVEQLTSKSKFNPTELAKAWQFSELVSQYNKELEMSGANLSLLAAQTGASAHDLYNEFKGMVDRYLELNMIVEELKKRYKINITDNDLKEWFDNMSLLYGRNDEVTFDDYVKNVGKDSMKEYVEYEKLFSKATEQCKIVEEVAE